MKERRLYDFFNDRFEEQLPLARTMEEAYMQATKKIINDLKFVPYKSFDSFIRLRKARKKESSVKKSPQLTTQ